MNKRLIAGITTILATAALLPSVAHATDSTIPDTIPTVCIAPVPTLGGPSRGVHPSTDTTLPAVVLPDCDAIHVCVVFNITNQIRPQTVVTEPDCAGVDPACVIQFADAGPSRSVHSPAGDQPKTVEVNIPDACRVVLASLATIPRTGGNTEPMVWLATSLVIIGGALLIGQRRLSHR